jgi:hypothetical protein
VGADECVLTKGNTLYKYTNLASPEAKVNFSGQ